MKKLNCNSLTEIPVSEELIQKTLAIPQNADQKPFVIFGHRRVVAAAAALVLISAVSLLLFMFTGKKPDEGFVTAPIKPTSAVETTLPTEPFTPTSTLPTESVNCVTPSEKVLPTDKSKPDVINDDVSSERSRIDAATVKKNSQSDNTQRHLSPTELLEPTLSPETEAPAPTEYEPAEPIDNTCYGYVYETMLTDKMYCFIADTASNIYGESDLFSSQHIASVGDSNDGWITISYNPDDYGIIPNSDVYTFTFYNEDGDIVYYDNAYFGIAASQGGNR